MSVRIEELGKYINGFPFTATTTGDEKLNWELDFLFFFDWFDVQFGNDFEIASSRVNFPTDQAKYSFKRFDQFKKTDRYRKVLWNV